MHYTNIELFTHVLQHIFPDNPTKKLDTQSYFSPEEYRKLLEKISADGVVAFLEAFVAHVMRLSPEARQILVQSLPVWYFLLQRFTTVSFTSLTESSLKINGEVIARFDTKDFFILQLLAAQTHDPTLSKVGEWLQYFERYVPTREGKTNPNARKPYSSEVGAYMNELGQKVEQLHMTIIAEGKYSGGRVSLDSPAQFSFEYRLIDRLDEVREGERVRVQQVEVLGRKLNITDSQFRFLQILSQPPVANANSEGWLSAGVLFDQLLRYERDIYGKEKSIFNLYRSLLEHLGLAEMLVEKQGSLGFVKYRINPKFSLVSMASTQQSQAS